MTSSQPASHSTILWPLLAGTLIVVMSMLMVSISYTRYDIWSVSSAGNAAFQALRSGWAVGISVWFWQFVLQRWQPDRRLVFCLAIIGTSMAVSFLLAFIVTNPLVTFVHASGESSQLLVTLLTGLGAIIEPVSSLLIAGVAVWAGKTSPAANTPPAGIWRFFFQWACACYGVMLSIVLISLSVVLYSYFTDGFMRESITPLHILGMSAVAVIATTVMAFATPKAFFAQNPAVVLLLAMLCGASAMLLTMSLVSLLPSPSQMPHLIWQIIGFTVIFFLAISLAGALAGRMVRDKTVQVG